MKLNDAVEYLTDFIINNMYKNIGTHMMYNKQNFCWSKKLDILYKKKQNQKNKNFKYQKRHKCEWNDLPKELLNDYNLIRKEFHDELNRNKEKHYNRINKYLIECNHSDKKFWDIVNNKHLKASHNIEVLYDSNNKPIYDPIKQAKLFHYQFTHPPKPEYLPHHKEFHEEIEEIIEQKHNTNDIKIKPKYNKFRNIFKLNKYTNYEINQLNRNIELYEIKNAIKNLTPYKASGPEKIHNLMIINGGKLY